MHLRKAVALGAAVVAAGVLGLTPAVQATITGTNITTIAVNGDATAGTDTVSGIFKSGTATYDALGFTASCTSGTVGGTVNRGPFTSGGTAFTFNSLSITCTTPLGINATISLNSGCTVPVTFGGVRPGHDNVHTGLSDTGTYTGVTQENHNVLGGSTFPAGNCVKVTLSSGGCVAYASGTTGVQFNEAQKTVGGVTYQDLILKSTSTVSLYGQNGSCLGIMQGTVSLNNIDFNIAASTGAIDFPGGPATPITGTDISNIGVGGSTVAGTDTISGVFKSGTATFDSLGFTATCASGTVGGTVNRGPFSSGGTAFTFTTLSMTCTSWMVGINATISLAAGCTVPVTMGGVRPTHDNVHTGLSDTGTYTGVTRKFHNVLGGSTAPAGNCVKVTLSSGGCVAYASGTTGVQFDEAQKTVGGVDYQDLIFKGTSTMSLYGQNGFCLGIMQGTVSLNNIDFNIKTGTGGAIDFR